MTPSPWKQWEGQVVDLCFPLRRYLGGTDRSAVYLTQYGDPEPRNAAIKLVLAESPESDLTDRWERAERLSHPNLLRLLRTGRSQVNQVAVRYAVSEYGEENLAEVLAERPLTAGEVREILMPLLDALAYVHREGLVHGHLKPANIMAVGDVLKLSVDGITLVGEPGAAPGLPTPYDPPEFSERGCSPVGDVWSFGVTLVEALTQRLPASGGPKAEPELPESVPAEFLPIVRACLRPDPRRRASLDQIRELFEKPVTKAAAERSPEPMAIAAAPPRKWAGGVLIGGLAVALAGILVVPHLLRRPVANAQTEVAVVAPGSTAVPAPEIPKAVEAPKAADPLPVEEKAPAAPPPDRVPAPAPVLRLREKAADTSGQVVRQVLPQVPDYARRTIRGAVKIQVRATVDAEGRVKDATVESQNSKYFAKLTLAAARQWEFAAVPGEWVLRFEFTTADTTVRPSRVGGR